jgi:hypothetical protein
VKDLQLSLDEAKLVELSVRTLEAGEFDRRIRALEETARLGGISRSPT